MNRPYLHTFKRPKNGCECDVSPRRGMALIDVIIGALLLGVGLAVIISISARSLASQTEGEKTLVAAWLADELLTMVLVEGPDEYHHLYDMEGWFYEPFDEFFYRVDIQDNGPGVAHSVVATVGWEQGRVNKEIQVEAAIAVRGGDPEQPREPRERVDRETRHYERLHGTDDLDDGPPVPRIPSPSGGSGGPALPGGGGGGRGGGSVDR